MSYPDQPPAGGPRRLGTAAIVVAVLAVVVVLGVIAGAVVIAVGGIGPLGTPDTTPPPGTAAPRSGDGTASPGQSPDSPDRPPASPLPPVTAANLPTSGDLVWPGSSWHVEASEAHAHDGAVTPCQTWAADAPPVQTAIQGRSYRLGEGEGRAYVYVISYPSVADAEAVAEALVADGLSCAQRLQGTQGPRLDVTGPLGAGVVTDLQWTDGAGPHVGASGVAREGTRVVWLWMEAAGEDADWLGVAEGHPMVGSLNHALRRLRVGG